MNTFYLAVFTLVSVSFNIDSIAGQQLGPFTIPTLANGGALGYSGNFLSALVDPQSRRFSFSAQVPQTGSSGGSVPSFSNLIGRYTNPFASFLPSQTNTVPIQTPSLSSFTPSNLPGVAEFSNVLRSFGNEIPNAIIPVQRAANQLQSLATNDVLNPSSAQPPSSSSIQLPGVSEFNNILRTFSSGIPSAIGRFRNAANVFGQLASNASQTVFNPSEILNQFAKLVPNIRQRALPLPNVKVSSNAEVSFSSDNAGRVSERFNSIANSVPEALSKLMNAPRSNVPVNHHDPHYYPGRQVMVHLFEWTFDDIAEECEKILGPAGYGGVQVSPVNEYVMIPYRPWWERYQPMSYIIKSRSGDEKQFASMVRRCQSASVRVYVDVVVNHMAAEGANVPLYGTAGSQSNPAARDYPAVPYNRTHFHPACIINNYQNATEVRDCELNALPDLNQTEPYVQDRIVDYMNRLIELGVAGFRIDGSKHMWPEDLRVIYKRLNKLNADFEFPIDADPFIYQEVIDLGNEPITASQYTDLGHVTEFKHSVFVGLIFRSQLKAAALEALTSSNATQYGLIPSNSSLVFVDNHDNQRGEGAGGQSILTFKDGSMYIQAIAFTLTTDYGTMRLMSSYNFTNKDQGPPSDGQEQILPPGFASDGSCQNGWVCEHRWPVVRRLVVFRNFVAPSTITDVQATDETFAFCRGTVGFAVFNTGQETHNGVWKTCLSSGEYCDIISGERVGTECSGTRVLVNGDGMISLTLPVSSSVVLDLLNRVS